MAYDRVEASLEKVNRQLDEDEEDRIAVITTPKNFAGIAILHYAIEWVFESAPDKNSGTWISFLIKFKPRLIINVAGIFWPA